MRKVTAERVALLKKAGPLTDVSHLRYQAVFTMGAAGSGKSFVANNRWLNYLPDPSGSPRKYKNLDSWQERIDEGIEEASRSLSNLEFNSIVDKLEQQYGIVITPTEGSASIPFELFSYDSAGREHKIDPSDWEEKLPPQVFDEVQGLTEVVFSTPKHEVPSYWRQVNPDLYKEELSGYLASQPGYVHEMSSDMSKAYFEAAAQSGDPLLVDGTGSNAKKMRQQIATLKAKGYRITLVWIYVPLTVNMIRNAVRTRKVLPDIIVKQFESISKNFQQLSSLVDDADYVDNRFDKMDKKNWKKYCEDINAFFERNTRFPTLYQYMLNTPQASEVKGPYRFVKFCGANPILEQEERVTKLKEKRDRLLGRTAGIGFGDYMHNLRKTLKRVQAYSDPCNGTSYYGEDYDATLEGLEECHDEKIRENKVEDAFDYLQKLADISDDFDFIDVMEDASSEYRLNSAEYEFLKWHYDNEM